VVIIKSESLPLEFSFFGALKSNFPDFWTGTSYVVVIGGPVLLKVVEEGRPIGQQVISFKKPLVRNTMKLFQNTQVQRRDAARS
jgi:hypothetical protein